MSVCVRPKTKRVWGESPGPLCLQSESEVFFPSDFVFSLKLFFSLFSFLSCRIRTKAFFVQQVQCACDIHQLHLQTIQIHPGQRIVQQCIQRQ